MRFQIYSVILSTFFYFSFSQPTDIYWVGTFQRVGSFPGAVDKKAYPILFGLHPQGIYSLTEDREKQTDNWNRMK